MFSLRADTRDAYLALFRERAIRKRYEAIAPPLPAHAFPLERASRIEPGAVFPAMRETDGAPNSRSRIEVLERGPDAWRYALEPVTGRKHQLRVHMAALGAPISNDALYGRGGDGPLQLLAKSVHFDDPIDGGRRAFESRFAL
jgi:tRNA pseudouridine32 synthase/23S rRNA pseudouridine746 synthase